MAQVPFFSTTEPRTIVNWLTVLSNYPFSPALQNYQGIRITLAALKDIVGLIHRLGNEWSSLDSYEPMIGPLLAIVGGLQKVSIAGDPAIVQTGEWVMYAGSVQLAIIRLVELVQAREKTLKTTKKINANIILLVGPLIKDWNKLYLDQKV
jgi:hypothetical protein